MPRNAEVIRQWSILREIEASGGVSIQQLAAMTGVTTRTIRRDLEALQEAGFPLYDEEANGKKRWRLDRRPFKGLADTSFTLSELAALYFSRTLLDGFAGTPFRGDLGRAFAKLETALPPRLRLFLSRLPSAMDAKPDSPRKREAPHQRETINRLVDAILHQRRVAMRYHSLSSQRQKDYKIDPYRLVYALGGLYLFAYVPEYSEIRTFAVERIRQLSMLQESFDRKVELGNAAFPHSVGTYEGSPEHVEIWFAPQVAPYVQERIWHPSQTLRSEKNGAIVVALEVSTDRALTSWILSYGQFARALAPPHLVNELLKELGAAGRLYER
jgi:predicted DNA-binding transcriptional regulator YafY